MSQLKTIVSIATEEDAGAGWHAQLYLAGVGTVHIADAYRETQSEAIVAVCQMAREKLGREFIPSSGNTERDFADWCDSLDALASLHGS